MEGDPADARVVADVCTQTWVSNNPSIVEDRAEASEFLWQKGSWANAPRPDLILLNLNLPERNDVEVLERIKPDKDLRRIPVVVLATSTADVDVINCYNLYANCDIVKPVDLGQFIKLLKSMLNSGWLL